jgi:hypothetical protein
MMLPMLRLSRGMVDFSKSAARMRTILRTGGMSALSPCRHSKEGRVRKGKVWLGNVR